jgi:hypothetical protein
VIDSGLVDENQRYKRVQEKRQKMSESRLLSWATVLPLDRWKSNWKSMAARENRGHKATLLIEAHGARLLVNHKPFRFNR